MHRRTKVSRTDIIDSYRDRFIFVDDQTEVLPGVFVCRINDPCEKFFCKDRSLKRLNKQKLLPDDFSHEIYMAVIEEGDCTIISSCSHNGIINIINDAQRRFPNARDTSFVGGLHMRGRRSDKLNCSKKYAQSVFLMVENYGLKKLHTGHCTGTKAYGLLKMHSQINAYYYSTGDTFIL